MGGGGAREQLVPRPPLVVACWLCVLHRQWFTDEVKVSSLHEERNSVLNFSHMYIYIYICMYICMFTYTCTYLHIYIYTCVNICVHMYRHMLCALCCRSCRSLHG